MTTVGCCGHSTPPSQPSRTELTLSNPDSPTVTVELGRDDLAALLEKVWGTLTWEDPSGAHRALQNLRTAYLDSVRP